ncbi:polymer-forming cytoskeletal protein [Cohnella caldifontis]|uniref:polymer-forming cytoskeletal protein n=1 Tax=Cohnella caldifontis TaxID=3027471 RepID=UPI0023EDD0BE|nr:polymer-forming cytoskeletal protein [Cohnella sp. YIM B05605]
MSETVLPDLRLVGTSTAAGGRYNRVKITGECEVSGDLACRKMSAMGNISVEGTLSSDELSLTGEAVIRGTVRAGTIRGRGELRFANAARVDKVDFTGNVSVRGDLEAERFLLSGACSIDGLLNADLLEIRLYGPCRVKEIGGESLVVKRSRVSKLMGLVNAGGPAMLTADVIEGDSVELSNTEAGVVRGNRVVIGPDCAIGKVEYRTSLAVHKSAVVKERVRI